MTFNIETSDPLVTPIDIPESKARARNSYILEYSWEDCIEAYLRRFPKHPRITVLADSFLLSRESAEKSERNIRRCMIEIDIPNVIKKALSITTLSFIQEMIIDRKKRMFRLNTINEFLIGRLEIHENVIMEPWNPEKQIVDYQNGKQCRFYQRATLKLPGLIPFSGQIEKIAMKNYQRSMSKGKYIDTKFILEMLAERKGVYLNLSRYKNKILKHPAVRSIPAFLLFLIVLCILWVENLQFSYLFLSLVFSCLLVIFNFFCDPIVYIFSYVSKRSSKQASSATSGMMVAAALADSSSISPKLLDAPGFRQDVFEVLCKYLKGPSGSSGNDALAAGLIRLGQMEPASTESHTNQLFSIRIPYCQSLGVYKSRIPPPPPVNHFPPKLLNLLVIKIEEPNSSSPLWITKTVRSFVYFWSKVKSILKRSDDDGLDFLSEFNVSKWNYSAIESWNIFLNKDIMITPSKQFQLEYLRIFADYLISKFVHDLVYILHEPRLQKKLTRKLFTFLCIDDNIITSRPSSFNLSSMHLKASHERGSSFPRSLPIAGAVSITGAKHLWREWFFSFAEAIPFMFLSTAREAGRFSIELAIPLGGPIISATKILESELSVIFPGGVYQLLYSCKLDMSSSTLTAGINNEEGTTCQLILAFSRLVYADSWKTKFISFGGSIKEPIDKTHPKTPILDYFNLNLVENKTEKDILDSSNFPPYILGKPFKMSVVINRPKCVSSIAHNDSDPVSLSAELLNLLIMLIGGKSQLDNFSISALPESNTLHPHEENIRTKSSKPDLKVQVKRIFYEKLSLLGKVNLISLYSPVGMNSQFIWNSKEKISFWINLYYTLILHQRFLSATSIKCAYDVGGFIFTSTDIRSCFVKRHHYLVDPGFSVKVSSSDPRRWLLELPDEDSIEALFFIFLSPIKISPTSPIVLSSNVLSNEEFISRLHLIASKALVGRITSKINENYPLIEVDNSLYPFYKYVEDNYLSYYSSSKWHKRVFFKRLLKFMPLLMIESFIENNALKRKRNKKRTKWRPSEYIMSYFVGSNNNLQHINNNGNEINDNDSVFTANQPQTSIDDISDAASARSECSTFSSILPGSRISVSSKLKITFTDMNLESLSLSQRVSSD